MKIVTDLRHVSLKALAVTAMSFCACTASAQAAPTAAPSWKPLAITAPTHLAPKQSEVQRVTIEAEGGTFALSRKVGEGVGTPVTQNGQLTLTGGSPTATIGSGTFVVGERVTVSSTGFIPTETTVLEVNGNHLTLSNAAEGSGTKLVKIFTLQMSSVTGGPFHVGDELVGTGLPSGTTVTAIGTGTLTLSKATTASYPSGPISLKVSEPTAPLAYDASAAEVQAALDVLPAFGPEAFTVTGGPGGDAGHPYFVAFGGELAEKDVEQFSVNAGGLVGEHAFAHVFTKIPGGAGTGLVVILPANVGAQASHGAVTVNVGPLPPGVVTTAQASGNGWTCSGAAGESTASCQTERAFSAHHSSSYPIDVPIEVQSTLLSSADAPVEISGGGAPAATYQLPIVVSDEPAPFGLAAVWAGSFEADGSPSTQAGGHPNSSAAYFMVNTVRTASGALTTAGDSKNVVVDLPPGFTGNPLASKRCPQSTVIAPEKVESELCNSEMSVGSLAPILGGLGEAIEFTSSLYNDVPPKGYAAEFTTKLAYPLQSVLATVNSEEDFGIRLTAPNNPNYFKIYGAFTSFEGVPVHGNGQALLTNPVNCAESAEKAPVVTAKANTYKEVGTYSETKVLSQPALTGCDKLKFEAEDPATGEGQVGFSFQPTSNTGSTPVGATAHLHIANPGLTDPNALATPELKRSVIKLPEGMSLNPSSANGLEGCSEAQIGYRGSGFPMPNPIRFDGQQPTCPDGSKLGTAEIQTPLLENPLVGTVYLANQEENPFGSLLAIYLVVNDPLTGVLIKLPGEVQTNPTTGRLTTTFDDNPQLPFEDLYLHFRGGGPRSEFATSEVCGTFPTEGEWTPWSAPESGPPAQTKDAVTISSGCASSAAARPFSPSLEAGTTGTQAGTYNPLVIKVNRGDGEQELTSLDFTLPEGLIGKLAGIPSCPESAIVAAEHKTGTEERASPSCPAASQIGTVDTSAGVGSEPFHVGGTLYLAGPYKGAPVSAVVVSPALAGPFDLGNVVVRSPLYLDRESAVLTAKSDPIPTILRGIPLKVRSVAIYVNRPGFILNPTDCTPMTVSSSLAGNSGATASPSSRFQVGGCESLDFTPKLKIKLKGSTKRAGNPALTATLTQAAGQANIGRASVALPRSEFLEQGHIRTVCTRAQFSAEQCPKGAIYGQAEAVTPLLEQPLTGPVYLRSSSHRLPDLVAVLKGPASQPIEIDLDGRIDSYKGGVRTTFEAVPDAPVSKFVLKMQGGKKGLLVNSTDICKGKHKSTDEFTGQNGVTHDFSRAVEPECGKKAGKGGGKGKGGK